MSYFGNDLKKELCKFYTTKYLLSRLLLKFTEVPPLITKFKSSKIATFVTIHGVSLDATLNTATDAIGTHALSPR